MVNKRIVTHHMAVAHLLTAVAEIIFLPVAPSERFRVKQPHFLNHLPLDIHTEAHCHRNPRITVQAAPLNQRRIFVNRHIFRHRVVPAEDRHGTERRTIRERRYGSVPPGQVGACLNLLHPAFRNDGIRIQQNHISIGIQHPLIYIRGKSLVLLIVQNHHVFPRLRVQPGTDAFVRAAVVNQENSVLSQIRMSANAVHT